MVLASWALDFGFFLLVSGLNISLISLFIALPLRALIVYYRIGNLAKWSVSSDKRLFFLFFVVASVQIFSAFISNVLTVLILLLALSISVIFLEYGRFDYWIAQIENRINEFEILLVIIFLLYAVLRWWSVKRDMLDGVEVSSQLAAESNLFVFINIFPQIMILILAISAISALKYLWKYTVPVARDAATKVKEPNYTEKINDIEKIEPPYIKIGGITTIIFLFSFLAINSSENDIFAGLLASISLFGFFLVLEARSEIQDLEKADIPSELILRKIKRDGAGLFARLASLLILLLCFTWFLDFLLGFYYSEVMVNSISVFSENSIQVLSDQEMDPTGIVDYYGFYQGRTVFNLGLSLFRFTLPLALIIILVPFVLKNLYFRGYKEISKVILTYIVFLGIGLTVDYLLEGGLSVPKIGVSSVVPMIGSVTAEQLTSWFKKQIGCINCESCGEQVSSEGTFCEFCGERKIRIEEE